MLTKEVLWCSIDNWYPLFKKVTFKTVILPIPNEVLDYLKSDGSLILPKECDDQDSDEEDNESQSQPSFPEFNQLINQAINEKLGGKIFPKLNWSAPRDASWMGVGHSLMCESLTQVWLLLKSSEFIVHDLTQPFKDCDDAETIPDVKYVLALKRWNPNINPATEFRCFVKLGQLVGIEQRDTTNFYSHIEVEKEDIVRDIQSFFNEHIAEKLPKDLNLVMDVTRPAKDNVKLIDFNPFGVTTDISLFEWSDFQADFESIDFRFVQSSGGIQPTGLRMYSLPKDIVDLACGTDHEKLVDFLQLQADLQNKVNIEDDSD